MNNYRLRAEGELLVLQVWIARERDCYSGYSANSGEWRDAKTEDIPVGDVFGSRKEVVTVYRTPDGEIFQG